MEFSAGDLGHWDCVSGQRRCGNTHIEGKQILLAKSSQGQAHVGTFRTQRADGAATSFRKGSDSKYYRPCGLDGLRHSRHQLRCVGLKAATGDGGSVNMAVSV